VRAPAYVDRIAGVLQCFNTAKDGTLTLSASTYEGFGQSAAVLTPPFAVDGLALPVLNLLSDGFSLRVDVVTRSGPSALWLPMAVARWTLKATFLSTQRRYVVSEHQRAGVRAALALMPAPSVQVEAGPEIWAGWRLKQALPAKAAGAALRRLAEQVHADPIENLTNTVPLAGQVRNWTRMPVEFVTVVAVDPSRAYDLADLHPAAPDASAPLPGVADERDRDVEAGRRRRQAPARA
jgi:hypothetical protein